MIWNLSLEAAYAKLLLAYSNFNSSQAISEFLAGDVANEHIS
jgi:L-asparaginase